MVSFLTAGHILLSDMCLKLPFYLMHSHIGKVILHWTAKFKSANIFAIMIWGPTANLIPANICGYTEINCGCRFGLKSWKVFVDKHHNFCDKQTHWRSDNMRVGKQPSEMIILWHKFQAIYSPYTANSHRLYMYVVMVIKNHPCLIKVLHVYYFWLYM